jgi:F-type H+-transporting ATPase subunit b
MIVNRLKRASLLAALLLLLSTTVLPAAAPAVDATGHGTDIRADHGAPKGEAISPIPPPPHGLAPAITTLVVFLLLVAVLGKYAWGPIAIGLKAREDKIRNDIRDAELARARAEETLRQYTAQLADAENRVRELLTKATADGERLATNIRIQAQQEAEEAKERAGRDIDAAKNTALREIYEEAGGLATAIAEKILRRNLNADDQRELVRSSLEQLQTAKA